MDYRPAVVNTVVGSWECDDADERTSSPSDDDSLLMTKSKSKVRRSKSNRGTFTSRRAKSEKRKAVNVVIKWLGDNYVAKAGSCLPRCVLYTHYQDFCKRSSIEAVSAPSFGKIVRTKFPELSTRRLGTRGKSKYHYFGLAIKESSLYYKKTYKNKGISRFANPSPKNEVPSFCLGAKTNCTLPEFPIVTSLSVDKTFPMDKLQTLLLMYRAHCQRLVDSVNRGNYDEIQGFLVHFWKGIPSHLMSIMGHQITLDVITVCDSILYQTICETLVSSSLNIASESSSNRIIDFSGNLGDWLLQSLNGLPPSLLLTKIQAAAAFKKSLQKELLLVKLAKSARNGLESPEFIKHGVGDLGRIDYSKCDASKAASLRILWDDKDITCIFHEFCVDFPHLVLRQSHIEDYFLWIDSLMQKCMNKNNNCSDSEKIDLCHDVFTLWLKFVTFTEEQLIINQAKSSSSFKTLFLLLSEYVCYVVDLIQSESAKQQYIKMIKTKDTITGVQKNTNCTNFSSVETASHLSSFKLEQLLDFVTPIPPKNMDPMAGSEAFLLESDEIDSFSTSRSSPLTSVESPYLSALSSPLYNELDLKTEFEYALCNSDFGFSEMAQLHPYTTNLDDNSHATTDSSFTVFDDIMLGGHGSCDFSLLETDINLC